MVIGLSSEDNSRTILAYAERIALWTRMEFSIHLIFELQELRKYHVEKGNTEAVGALDYAMWMLDRQHTEDQEMLTIYNQLPTLADASEAMKKKNPEPKRASA